MIDIANFKVTKLEVDFLQQTYNTKVAMRLASIDLQHFRQNTSIPLISTPFSSGIEQYLFTVVFTQVK